MGYFASFLSHFAPGLAYARDVKGFVALIKHEICMKYEKCIASVSYFVVCFAKYLRNAKYEKRVAGLMGKMQISEAYISTSIK